VIGWENHDLVQGLFSVYFNTPGRTYARVKDEAFNDFVLTSKYEFVTSGGPEWPSFTPMSVFFGYFHKSPTESLELICVRYPAPDASVCVYGDEIGPLISFLRQNLFEHPSVFKIEIKSKVTPSNPDYDVKKEVDVFKRKVCRYIGPQSRDVALRLPDSRVGPIFNVSEVRLLTAGVTFHFWESKAAVSFSANSVGNDLMWYTITQRWARDFVRQYRKHTNETYTKVSLRNLLPNSRIVYGPHMNLLRQMFWVDSPDDDTDQYNSDDEVVRGVSVPVNDIHGGNASDDEVVRGMSFRAKKTNFRKRNRTKSHGKNNSVDAVIGRVSVPTKNTRNPRHLVRTERQNETSAERNSEAKRGRKRKNSDHTDRTNKSHGRTRRT